MGHINALWKNPENHILHGWLYFPCLKILNRIINFENASISSNVLLTILSFVRSFVISLKKYCWDKSGFASCKVKQFLQTRFFLFSKVFLWTYTPRYDPSVPLEHMLSFQEWLMCSKIKLKRLTNVNKNLNTHGIL